MSEEPSFRDFILRVRAGDAEAARELVRRYEPAIRTAVRVRLTDRSLRRVLDSMDICNSVLGSFFVRVAAGQYELEEPKKLLNLLVTIAQRKLHDVAKHERAGRRGGGKGPVRLPPGGEPADTRCDPAHVVANREVLHLLYQRLSPAHRRLWDQRALDRSWEEIAANSGQTPAALRQQFGRAVKHAARTLQLDI